MVTKKKPNTGNRKCAYIFFTIAFLVFWMLYLQTPTKPTQSTVPVRTEYILNVDLKYLINNLTLPTNETDNLGSRYVVYSSKCKIPNMNPYNTEIMPYFSPKKYVKCRNKKLLTYVTKQENVATLHVDERLIYQYSSTGVHCCYSTVTRGQYFETSNSPDTIIDVSPCIDFHINVTLTQDFILVSCKNPRSKEVYKNVHATITITEEIEEKMQKFEELNKNHLSVLFVGIDSISRTNMVRSLPKTNLFLKENDWMEFKGYNKIGDNTFPNLMAILTGLNNTMAHTVCNPQILGRLDKCDMLWHDYRRLGFITGYGEDEAEIGTFNFQKKGFKYQPTDYYFRPYILATENNLKWVNVDVVKYCTGPEVAGERVFNLAREFTSTFRNFPNFGFFWMNSYSHNEVNSVSRMDEKVVQFLKDIHQTEILENSIVIFLSDHGFRFGSITYTHAGWLEERLPFFYMSVPKWFKEKFPIKYQNLVTNTERLTTPYDVYMTLQDILVIAGKNYSVKTSDACPKCKSLFEEIEKERSCQDAGIEGHWCTCSEYRTIPIRTVLVTETAKFILSEIHKTQVNTGVDHEQCLDFEIIKILSASISQANSTTHKNLTYLLITFQTLPEAVFQGTVSVNMNLQAPDFKIEGSISRLDMYGEHSWCVSDSILKKYCYCQSRIKYVTHSVSSFIQRVRNIFSIF